MYVQKIQLNIRTKINNKNYNKQRKQKTKSIKMKKKKIIKIYKTKENHIEETYIVLFFSLFGKVLFQTLIKFAKINSPVKKL